MDTFVTITVVAESKETADNAIEKAFDVIEKYGDLINFFSDKSELSAINRSAGMHEVQCISGNTRYHRKSRICL